jgi:hypothetical protein
LLYDDVYVVIYWLFIVINYINLFVFDDEIEMKNRSTIQTLTFVQTNLDHLYRYMKLNMPGTCNLLIIHSFGKVKHNLCDTGWLFQGMLWLPKSRSQKNRQSVIFRCHFWNKQKYNIDINICTNKSGPFIPVHETEHARYM